jgi:activating signal cointegrator complex subunit 3
VGYSVQDSVSKKLAQLAQKLRSLQRVNIQESVQEDAKGADGDDAAEFGAGFDFKAPSRFVIDVALDDDLPLGSGGLGSYELEQRDACGTSTSFSSNAVGGSVNLRWLKDQCDLIATSGGSMLSGDELAMALCRVLRSNKAGDEVLQKMCFYYSPCGHSHLTFQLCNLADSWGTVGHGWGCCL